MQAEARAKKATEDAAKKAVSNGGARFGLQDDGTVIYPPSPKAPSADVLDGRTIHTFKLPPACRGKADDPWTVSVITLRLSDEMAASKVAKGDDEASVLELVKRFLYAANGIRFEGGTEEAVRAFSSWSPKVRDLTLRAHRSVHVPDAGDVSDFLASVEVGI